MRNLLVLGLMLIAVAGCSHKGGNTATTGATGGDTPSIYFLQVAGGGALSLSKGSGTLTLTKVSPHVIWVSDRPVRETGNESLEKFVADWDANGFKDDPPNVIIESLSEDGALGVPESLVLSKPAFDSAAGSVTYAVATIPGGDAPDVATTMRDITVFIDGADVGNMTVKVVDQNGAPLINALIQVNGLTTDTFKSAATQSNSSATFSNLPPDLYIVMASILSGPENQTSTQVNAGGTANVTISIDTQ